MNYNEINMNLNNIKAKISDLEYEIKKVGIHSDPDYYYNLKREIKSLAEEEDVLITELQYLCITN